MYVCLYVCGSTEPECFVAVWGDFLDELVTHLFINLWYIHTNRHELKVLMGLDGVFDVHTYIYTYYKDVCMMCASISHLE